MANTPLRNIRVDDGLWQAFEEATRAAGSDRTKVLTAFMRWYVAERTGAQPDAPDEPCGWARPGTTLILTA